MAAMRATPPPAPAAFSRRALLAASAGLALLTAGCTGDGPDAPAVSTEEADRLAGQVAVQEAVVAAYAAATTADPALALSDLSAQAAEQLDRLRAAAPSATRRRPRPPPHHRSAPAGADVRTWLRGQLATAAGSHARRAPAVRRAGGAARVDRRGAARARGGTGVRQGQGHG
jgi:hypothetical protein